MIDLAQADEIYRLQTSAEVILHRVSHRGFREFALKLQNFIRLLGEEIETEDWRTFTRRLKRYRFEMCAAPLGFGNLFSASDELTETLADILHRQNRLDSEYVEAAQAVFDVWQNLVEEDENPLLEKLSEIFEESPLLIKESRLIAPMEKVLAAKNLNFYHSVIGEAQLRGGSEIFRQMACFGASRWFSEFVYAAPRAEEVNFFRFDWMADKLPAEKSFLQTVKTALARSIRVRETVVEIETETIESEEIAPQINLAETARSFAGQARQTDEIEVEARMIRLEGRRGIFLEEAARHLLIDLEADTPIQKFLTNEITTGMFVIVRDSERGGDLIVPLANKILGAKTQTYRQFQSSWKEMLGQLVRQNGFDLVVSELQRHGSLIANEINLRNWLSPSNIKTRAFADFAALMRLVGFGDKAQNYWNISKEIDKAHKQAGRRIQKILLRKVGEVDLNELERLGEMRFSTSGGRMRAVRVVQKASETTPLSAKHLNKIIENLFDE